MVGYASTSILMTWGFAWFVHIFFSFDTRNQIIEVEDV